MRTSGSILVTGIIDGVDGKDGKDGKDGQQGPQGPAGNDVGVLEFTGRNPAIFRTDINGVTVSRQTLQVSLRIRTAGGVGTPAADAISCPTSHGNISFTKTAGGFNLEVAANKSISDGCFTITASATINGKSYSASGNLNIICNRSGAQGEVGPWKYFAGPWKSDVQYDRSSGTPIVLASNSRKYALTGALANGCSLDQDPSNPTYQNGAPWEQATDGFKFLVDVMVFTDNSQFGSFVFNKNWLISTSGSIGGTPYYTSDIDSPATVPGESLPAYTHFNPVLPDGKFKVPMSSTVIISSAVTNNAFFDLPGGHTYYFYVTIATFSPADTNGMSLDIYLREVGNNTNLKVLTIGHAGRFKLGPYTPSTAKSLRICCVCVSGVTASVSAVMVVSDTVFVPRYAVDGLSGRTYQKDAHVEGEITATNLFASDGLFTTEISPGIAEFRSILAPLSVLRIGADANGMIFQMTDSQGRMIWNLGGSSNGIGSITSGGGDWTTVYYKSISGSSPGKHEIEYVTIADCTKYYRYNGQWASANGTRQFAEGEAAKDGIVHTSMVSAANSSLIANGYYVQPNNGVFMTEAADVEGDGSGSQKKIVRIFRFASGKIAQTIEYEFY